MLQALQLLLRVRGQEHRLLPARPSLGAGGGKLRRRDWGPGGRRLRRLRRHKALRIFRNHGQHRRGSAAELQLGDSSARIVLLTIAAPWCFSVGRGTVCRWRGFGAPPGAARRIPTTTHVPSSGTAPFTTALDLAGVVLPAAAAVWDAMGRAVRGHGASAGIVRGNQVAQLGAVPDECSHADYCRGGRRRGHHQHPLVTDRHGHRAPLQSGVQRCSLGESSLLQVRAKAPRISCSW